MIVSAGASSGTLAPETRILLDRALSPFCGVVSEMAFVMRGAREPSFAVAVGSIGAGESERRPLWSSSQHIAGIGATAEEAVLRCLAESLERYAQLIWPSTNAHKIVTASYRTMQGHSRLLVPASLTYFSDAQLARPGFPFSRFEPDAPIGWVAMESLISGAVCWVPAQAVLPGYRREQSEPTITAGVSSGTAAHRSLDRALRGALLELIQVDAAMGNWYGDLSLVAIRHDERTRFVEHIINQHSHPDGPIAQFYYLPSADLTGTAVMCILTQDEVPRFAAGLGCDLRLSRAMYKAFLEAVAVAHLAKAKCVLGPETEVRNLDPAGMYDLDSNVVYYAMKERSAFAPAFRASGSVTSSELPPDVDLGARGDVRYLISSFRETGKELVVMDLTSCDVRDLGFRVVRVWSPDTVNLSLPSAPPVMDRRFDAYGGAKNGMPHPFP